MIKYRLRFKFKKDKIEVNRENQINDILSNIDNIESNEPIRKPQIGEFILISDEEYTVKSVFISFDKEGDITYYDFIVEVENLSVKKAIEEEAKKKAEERDKNELYKKLLDQHRTLDKKYTQKKYYL